MTGDERVEDDLLAAELAFGLLDEAERQAAQARTRAEPAFAAAVTRWTQLAGSTFPPAPEAPPPAVWAAVMQRLPANDDTAGAAGPSRGASATGWRVATASMGAVAIALGLAALRPQAPAPAPKPAAIASRPLVSVLRGGDGQAVIAVSFDRDGKGLAITPSALAPTPGSIELWVIPADGKPRSLGIVATAAPQWRVTPAALAGALTPGATLVVTAEPNGGSPSGQPSTKPFLTGTLTRT